MQAMTRAFIRLPQTFLWRRASRAAWPEPAAREWPCKIIIDPAYGQVCCARERGSAPLRTHVCALHGAQAPERRAVMSESQEPQVMDLAQVESPEKLTPEPKRLQRVNLAEGAQPTLTFKQALEGAAGEVGESGGSNAMEEDSLFD